MNVHIELAANYATYSFFGLPIFIHQDYADYYAAMDKDGDVYAYSEIPEMSSDGIWRCLNSSRSDLIKLFSMGDFHFRDSNLVTELIRIASTYPHKISDLPLLK